ADYRYFPDPDLPPLVIADEWVCRVRAEMTDLPRVMAARFMADYGLSEYDATQLTQSKAVAAYFEETAKVSGQAKLACNWVTGELARRLNTQELSIVDSPVVSSLLGKLISRITDNTISNNAAKQVFDALWTGEGKDVDAIIETKGLKQMSDTGELEGIIDGIIAANTKSVEEYKAGNAKAFNALVGQAMKATKGKGNPAQVNELLKKKLS
ncbi:MAG TPA: Asp-tRNA(Asn)/Glu-tRNA(Gln) amidotransferase GatCAB subunit B, partial [Burkholderiaceae bacterium]|nr:Asp-tRNA(Asn)/Glu-tRNA(Gln) amidotransferase GatCAB subunit B [Burkholderiaceae bacterium]